MKSCLITLHVSATKASDSVIWGLP